MSRRWFSEWSGAAALAFFASTATAQGRPTVFMHGFGAEARDWADTAERLRAAVAIEPHIPSLMWRETFETQARILQATPEFVTLPTTALAVGHSNGGLVAREWSRARRIDGVATIGTPHRGAPILGHLFDWVDFNMATLGALGHVATTFSVRSDWWWVFFFVDNSLRWVSDFSIWSVVNLATTLGVKATAPVAYEMVPGSPYLNGLNSGLNLAREAAEIPNRVGIVSVAHNFYFAGPARAIAPDQADAIAMAMYGSASGLLLYGNFMLANAAPTDVAANQQAMALIGLAFQVLSIDPFYCRIVSTRDASQCLPNDGLVPIDSQAYPGAPNLIIGLDDHGPAHTQEKQRSDDALYHALVAYMHVPPRSAAAPVPPPGPPPDQNPLPPPTPDPNADPSPDPLPASESDPVTTTTGELHPDDVLNPDDAVNSPDGRLHFTYQGDGNLVLYDVLADVEWTPLWASNTAGTRAGRVAMQGDGNLVIYDPDSVPLWSSDTSLNHPGAHLVVQNDGNVVIYDVDGTPLWSTDTFVQ